MLLHFGHLLLKFEPVICDSIVDTGRNEACLKKMAQHPRVPTCGSEPPHVLLLSRRGCLRHHYIRVVVSCPSAQLSTLLDYYSQERIKVAR